jgi:myo-inositol-1(or 4)-monophosphatase
MTELWSLLSFAEALARRCGQEASAFFGRQISQRKDDGSLVTETDKTLDRIITGAIRERFPQHGILSEEQSTLYDPSRGCRYGASASACCNRAHR